MRAWFSIKLKANHLVTPLRISARLPFWSWPLYNYWWIRWNSNSGNTKLSTHLITQLLVTFRIFIIAGKGHVITICYDSVTRLIETNSFSSLLWALQLYCRKKKIALEICYWRFDSWRYVMPVSSGRQSGRQYDSFSGIFWFQKKERKKKQAHSFIRLLLAHT